jgi:hypothetical protein
VLAAALFLAATVALESADLRSGPWATILILAVPVAFGFAIGEWWAVFLSLLILILVPVLTDEDMGLYGTWVLTALITVPLEAIALAVGVAARLDLVRLLVARGQRR